MLKNPVNVQHQAKHLIHRPTERFNLLAMRRNSTMTQDEMKYFVKHVKFIQA